jgi:hypothetical protein
MGLRPTVWSDALASWAGLLAQQAKVILPLYVVLAVIHARAITRPSFGVRAVAWIGVILLILFTAAQVLALVLQQMVILHSAGSV